MSEVRLRIQRFGLRPPPFMDLLFQVDLENTGAGPLWFLFPLYLDRCSGFDRLLASAAEVFELPGEGRVRVARFLGDGSFQALRLPAGARVRIGDFPITLTGDPPKTEVAIPVILAEQLSIGEERAEEWFEVDLMSSVHAQVTDEPGAIIASQETPGARPVRAIPSGMRTLMLRIPLQDR